MHDVVVVGAGVAGSTTALRLARSGYDVLLLDRAQFPRRKVCGEAIFSSGVQALKALGAWEEVSKCSVPIQGLQIEAAGHVAKADFSSDDDVPLGVRRTDLDELLLKRAKSAGVSVRLGVVARRLVRKGDNRFVLETNEGEIAAGLIVGADGVRSALRTQAGLDVSVGAARYGCGAHVSTGEPAGHEVQIYLRRSFEMYLTPVAPNELNIALLTDKRGTERLGRDLSAAFERVVTAVRPDILCDFLDEPHLVGPFPARCSRAAVANLVLVGDAAGFSDPITGQGISLALESARLAAAAIERALQGESHSLDKYSRQMEKLRRPSGLVSTALLACARYPAAGRWFFRNLEKQPLAFKRLVQFNDGAIGLPEVGLRDLSRAAFGF